MHALVLHADGRPAALPATRSCSHAGDLGDVEATRRLVLDLAPDEVYNLAAISSVAQSWDEPDLTAQVNGLAAVALMESARQVGDRVRLVQASSAEIFGEPADSPQDEATPVRAGEPVRRREGLRPPLRRRLPPARPARRRARSSTTTSRRAGHERFVTRKITSTVAAIARGEADELVLGNLDARRDWGWAPDYVDAMVRAARADEPGDYVIATGVAHSVRDFVAAAFAAAGIDDWEQLVRQDAAFFRPGRPDRAGRRRAAGARRAGLGADGGVRRDRGRGWWRPTSPDQPCWSRPSRYSP